MTHPLVPAIVLTKWMWRIVYSSGDRRSADLLNSKLGVQLYEISPDVDPYQYDHVVYDMNVILLGGELANPYVKLLFPTLKVDYDTGTFSGLDGISSDGKRVIHAFKRDNNTTVILICGFSEEDTWQATHEFLQITYIPPTAKFEGYFVGRVVKLNPLMADSDLAKQIKDKLNEITKEHNVIVGDVQLRYAGQFLNTPFPEYYFGCPVYEGESPIAPIVIGAIIAVAVGAGLLGLWFITQIAYYVEQTVQAQASIERDKLRNTIAEALTQEEYCTDKYHDLKALLDKVDEYEPPTTPPPTDWMSTLMNMLPMILMFALFMSVIRMMPREKVAE